jgi:hypothetical protein
MHSSYDYMPNSSSPRIGVPAGEPRPPAAGDLNYCSCTTEPNGLAAQLVFNGLGSAGTNGLFLFR